MNQQWLIDHVLSTADSIPPSPPDNDRSYRCRDEAERIVGTALDYVGANGDETEYTYMRGHRERLINTLTMIPKAESEGARLLDIGSYGYMAFWAKRHLGYETVIGIEWHPELPDDVIYRQLRVGDDVVEMKSYNFDISEASWPIEDTFDTVLFFEVLEHINSDPMGVMEQINGHLRHGGVLAMSVPNAISYKTLREFMVGMPPWTYWFYEPDLSHEPRHCFEYTPIVFRSLLAAAGMETEAFRIIYAYSTQQQEQSILGVAETLGFEAESFGETMIALATKTQEGVPLRYPDVLYSPEGYYKTVYPALQTLLHDRVQAFHERTAQHITPDEMTNPPEQLIEAKPAKGGHEPALDGRESSLEQELAELTIDRDRHRTWALGLQEQGRTLESQVAQLLFQSDCWMQREQELSSELVEANERVAQAENELENTREWGARIAQENADLKSQVDELLFACDCYLQQINDPGRCVRVIRQRRFRWALDRTKSVARKTPIARTVLRPLYRSAKKAVKRRM
ncbi:MAG: methyltransferase domain-containing protein [Phycisphaerales bacterium]